MYFVYIHIVIRKEIVWQHGPCILIWLLFFHTKLNIPVRPERACIIIHFDMAGKVEFQYGEDLDAVFEIINEDLFEEDEDLEQQMSAVVLDIQENSQDTGFKCDFCEKVCKSKRGCLSRHKNSKHKVLEHEDDIVSGSSPEDLLHPLHLKNYIIKSASKLVDENCLSASRTLDHFRNYEVSLDDANYTCSFIRQIIAGYNGNAEKFYPEFYKCVSDNIAFRNLSKKCATLLGFKLATYILAHLSGSGEREFYRISLCQINSKGT